MVRNIKILEVYLWDQDAKMFGNFFSRSEDNLFLLSDLPCQATFIFFQCITRISHVCATYTMGKKTGYQSISAKLMHHGLCSSQMQRQNWQNQGSKGTHCMLGNAPNQIHTQYTVVWLQSDYSKKLCNCVYCIFLLKQTESTIEIIGNNFKEQNFFNLNSRLPLFQGSITSSKFLL